MLPAYNSPPSALLSCISMWNAFEDDKLLFFDLPSARLFLSYSFQWSDQTRNHKHTCRDVQGTKPRLLLQALWLALQLATRLSGLTLPEPLSHYHPLSLQKKKKAKDGVRGKIQSQWRKFSQIFGCTSLLCFFLLELDSSLSVFPPNASLAMLPQNQIQTWKKSAFSHSAET